MAKLITNSAWMSTSLCILIAVIAVDSGFSAREPFSNFDTTGAHRFSTNDVADLRPASQSKSFIKLRDNVMSVISSLSTDEIDKTDKELLTLTFADIFRDYQNKTLEEFQPAQDQLRRIPYGTIHRLAHDAIDNLGINPSVLGKVHRDLHYAFTNSYDSDICYPMFAKNHTGCLERLGQTGCPKMARGVNEAQKKVILAVHNKYRSEVARGQVEIHGIQLPEAAAMARMAWDQELEALAQAWADQCIFSTDCQECRRTDRLRFVGQSILRFRNVPEQRKPNWRLAIDTLARKSRDAWPNDSEFLRKYRHDDSWATYTQMIWDFTYLVGCGYSLYEDKESGGYTELYVCNYGPAGNMIGHEVYVPGKACSKCPQPHKCDHGTGICTYGEESPAPAGFRQNPIISQLQHKIDV